MNEADEYNGVWTWPNELYAALWFDRYPYLYHITSALSSNTHDTM